MKYTVLIITLVCSQFVQAANSEFANYLALSKEFEDLLGKGKSIGQLPRVNDKKVSAIVKKLSKSQKSITARKYTEDDLFGLLDVCEKANKFGMAYLMDQVGPGFRQSGLFQKSKVNVAKRMAENSVKYQDELKVFYPFLIDCSAIQLTLIEPFWKSLPVDQRTQIRINGIKQMQRGILQVYVGVLASLGDSSFKASFKDSLLASALYAAPVMAAALSLDKRNEILRRIGQLKKTAPRRYIKAFDSIYQDFSSKKCNEICQL